MALPLVAISAMLAACVDDLGLGADKPSKLEQVYFTASVAEQDFFGEHKPQTLRQAQDKRSSAVDERQRVKAGFYDLAIDGRSDIRLSVSTVDGMFGKATPIPEEGKDNRKVRGAMLTELQQEPMRVMEIAQTSAGKTIVGEAYSAYTEDGASWGGSLMEHNSNTTSRTIRAIYPESNAAQFGKDGSTIECTIQPDAADQKDFLFAQYEQTLGQQDKEELHLTFDHLLTAVRFKVGGQQLPMSVIKSISISGVATRGSYNCQSRSWNIDAGSKGTVTANLDFNVTGVENTVINGAENTFMLLPQQLPTDAKVTIEYEDYTEGDESSWGTKTLTASLATANTPAWEAGQCITYTLMDHSESSEYVLEVETPSDFTPDGGTQAVNVLSYRHVEGVRTPMRWLVQSYSSDGGKTWMNGGNTNPPKGLAISPMEGTSTEPTPISVTIVPADTTSAPHRDFLRYATPLGYGTDGAFDLSTHDYKNQPCLRTTANCYVVDAPGKYRFPTAYGNAIVSGETNKKAYSGTNIVDYRGKSISAPMIKNNGISLSRATLVWEDAQDLIDPASIKLVDEGSAVEFEILADNIDQGNAVIAVMDGGNNIVWSWHIWVNDEKATLAEPIEDQNKYGESVGFMPLTLGWCSTSSAVGAVGREAAVRITMPGHMTSRASFRIRQVSTPAHDVLSNAAGNAPYYNWGRKAPFPGAASTQTPVGTVTDNMNCQPKKFYQAGADAAGMGLHSELHVSYGPNYVALFTQGMVVGFDGFLTGMMLGRLYNALSKSLGQAAAEAAAKNLVSTNAEVAMSASGQNLAEATVKVGEMVMRSKEPLAVVLREMGAATVEKTLTQLTVDGVVETGLRIFNKEGAVIACATILMQDELSTVFIIQQVVAHSAQASIAIGPFSAVIMNGVAHVAANEFGLGSFIANASFYTGGTDWCKEMKDHGVSTAYAIQHPNILFRDPIAWNKDWHTQSFWNTAQGRYDDQNTAVVKSIYDPCPAGYCVPTCRDFSGITDTSSSYDMLGSTIRRATGGKNLVLPGLGYRNFWGGEEPGAAATNNINTLIYFNGNQGMYWTASPAISESEYSETGAYAIHLRGSDSYDDYGEEQGVKYTPRIINNLKLQQSYALPIRPVREKR